MNSVFSFLLIVVTPGQCCGDDPPVIRLTVVGIVASERHQRVPENLKCLAEMVQKDHPKLTGFELGRVSEEQVKIGGETEISVCKFNKFSIKVKAEAVEDGKIRLTLTPPQDAPTLTYKCCCDKFFPMMTGCRTPDGDRLIIAVMSKRCDKDKD